MKFSSIKIFKKIKFWVGLLLAQIILFLCASKIPAVVNLFVSFFEFQKKIHQQLFSQIPFSAGDLFYLLLGATIILLLGCILFSAARRPLLIATLVGTNVFYFSYQLFWGMLYFQPPLMERLTDKKLETEQLKILAADYLDRCKTLRNQVKEDHNGIFHVADVRLIQHAILEQQKKLPVRFSSKHITEVSSFKASLFKSVISYTGILGYYNPFTAEATYNRDLPATYLPFTLAHESAHQLGFAREQEANFIGYLIGVEAENLALRYSTDYYVLKSILNALAEQEPDFVSDILASYTDDMKRDRLAEKSFIKRHEGVLDQVFGFTNDLFLKSNQQDGIVTYSYFLELLLRYHFPGNGIKK